MLFEEACTEIERFLLEVARAEFPETPALRRSDVGEDVVGALEVKLKRSLPTEFKAYMRKGIFGTFLPFYQDFELLRPEELGPESSEYWGDFPEAAGILGTPLVIGTDASVAFVADLDDSACPVFRVDEVYDWIPQKMAHSLADFLYLLSYREMIYGVSLALGEANGWKPDKTGSQAAHEKVNNKIRELAPECLSQWA